MAYDTKRPITAQNCPTREALERKPGDKGFLMESIGAKHTSQKAENHRRNLIARSTNKGRRT